MTDPRRLECVQDVPEACVRDPSVVRVGDPISRAIETLLARPERRAVHVVDAEGKLVGTVGFRDLLRVTNARFGASPPTFFSLVTQFRGLLPERVEEVMRKPTPIKADFPLRDALVLLETTQQNDLPIVDAEGRLVGALNGAHILKLALAVFQQTEADLERARGSGSPPP